MDPAPFRLAVLAVLATLAPAQSVVFVRGGAGTGGFLEGGNDEQLSDIANLSEAEDNHGYGQLAALLAGEGFLVTQVVEGPAAMNTKVDLAALGLGGLDVLVLGSNNASYDATDRELVADWVCQGGGALFISDANWGQDWADAPDSDQTFLDAFDLVVNQDTGVYALVRQTGDFVVNGVDMGGHPILAGPDLRLGTADDVDVFDGEGVSPFTVVDADPGLLPAILAGAEGDVRKNDDPAGGTIVPAGRADGALVVLEYGTGRVAGHFDRNTFFNRNGAGTDITRFDNAQYAKNLFGWLASGPGVVYGSGCAGSGGFVPQLGLTGCPRPGALVTITVDDALGGAPAAFALGIGEGAGTVWPGGCPRLVDPILALVPLVIPGQGAGAGALAITATIPLDAALVTATLQLVVVDPAGPGGYAASAGLRLPVF